MKTDESFGVVPVLNDTVLVINQYGSAGDTYWGFPKGHREGEETREETALRELKEETGLSAELSDRTVSQTYTFRLDGEDIKKTVTYYIGTVIEDTVRIDEDEVAEARWCSVDDALELLTHEGTKQMLKEALG